VEDITFSNMTALFSHPTGVHAVQNCYYHALLGHADLGGAPPSFWEQLIGQSVSAALSQFMGKITEPPCKATNISAVKSVEENYYQYSQNCTIEAGRSSIHGTMSSLIFGPQCSHELRTGNSLAHLVIINPLSSNGGYHFTIVHQILYCTPSSSIGILKPVRVFFT